MSEVTEIKVQEPINVLKGHKAVVSCLSLSPSGNLLVSGSQDSTVRIWDLKLGKVIKAIKDCFVNDRGEKSEVIIIFLISYLFTYYYNYYFYFSQFFIFINIDFNINNK